MGGSVTARSTRAIGQATVLHSTVLSSSLGHATPPPVPCTVTCRFISWVPPPQGRVHDVMVNQELISQFCNLVTSTNPTCTALYAPPAPHPVMAEEHQHTVYRVSCGKVTLKTCMVPLEFTKDGWPAGTTIACIRRVELLVSDSSGASHSKPYGTMCTVSVLDNPVPLISSAIGWFGLPRKVGISSTLGPLTSISPAGSHFTHSLMEIRSQ
mmetsp:Transcript_80629/g.184731  ORF Transcript_80629/g.184731 Transcript_80629/m.184731 type:complete len:211 (-) Transcript_80629:215-847(-)